MKQRPVETRSALRASLSDHVRSVKNTDGLVPGDSDSGSEYLSASVNLKVRV